MPTPDMKAGMMGQASGPRSKPVLDLLTSRRADRYTFRKVWEVWLEVT